MRSILVVDDEPHATRLLARMLAGAGYDVDTAGDGQEAFERLASRHYDVLITDIQMPRMTGRELCERLRKDSVNDEPLIVVMTSRPEDEHREWTREFRRLDFLEKPLSPRQLIEHITARLAADDGGPGPAA